MTLNKLAAPNPAMTSLFQAGRYWRGIGEPDRSTLIAAGLEGNARCRVANSFESAAMSED